jgi:hypothetical protein
MIMYNLLEDFCYFFKSVKGEFVTIFRPESFHESSFVLTRHIFKNLLSGGPIERNLMILILV